METDCDLDLTALSELTGGDSYLESALFEVFISNANEAIDALRTALADRNDADWRKHAHYLKGAASNLGASQLTSLCSQAETMSCADHDALAAALRNIEQSSTTICSLLERRMTSPDTTGQELAITTTTTLSEA